MPFGFALFEFTTFEFTSFQYMVQSIALTDEPKTLAPAQLPGPLPDWYPAWAAELANLYFSGTTCVFVLH